MLIVVVYSEMKKERREGKNFLLKFNFCLGTKIFAKIPKKERLPNKLDLFTNFSPI